MRALAFLLTLWASSVGAIVQTEITLYRNAQVPLIGYPSGAWHWPGVAMSASMSLLYSHRELAVESCRWAFSWTPESGASPTGIRLVAVLDGQVIPLAAVTMPHRSTPTSDGRDVTEKMRWLLSLQRSAWLGMQTVGNGLNGPKVYHSVIECIWQ